MATALLLLGGCGAGFASTGDGSGSGGPPLPANPRGIPLEFTVRNDAATDRAETIRVSVPFAQGGYRDAELHGLTVSGKATAWHVMQHWPDGTVRMAQAQFTDLLGPGALRSYRIADGAALSGPFVRNPWVAQQAAGLEIGADVQDTFHVSYRASVTGAGEVLAETPLVQVRRHRTYHQPFSGVGMSRDFLTSTFYITEYRDVPVVVVDWLLGNDYLGADNLPPSNTDPNMHPLGVVDVMSAGFLCKGMTSATGYRAAWEAISGPVNLGGGQLLFPVMQNTWMQDGQTRRYRFVLYCEDSSASAPVRALAQQTQAAMVDQPLFPLATLQTWQDTAGAGTLGGPITGPADAANWAAGELASWNAGNYWGTWGSHGEVQATATTGTPRNTPLSPELAHAIQGGYHPLLLKIEQLAWAQAMRPYHMYGLTVGAEQDVMLWEGIPVFPGSRDLSHESFGRRILWQSDPYSFYRTLWPGNSLSHGWEPYDHEHWSFDSLFDYWSISDDAWAHEELRQVGQSLKGLMRLSNAYTAGIQAARAEGWCMQGFVQVYLATGDASIKDYAQRRAHEVVDVQRSKDHPSKAMTIQGDYPQTGYPTPNRFFMPWQHGAVLYGYLAAYRHFGDPLLMQIAEDVVTTVEYSSVHNFTDPYLGFIPDGLRYYVPFSYNQTPIPASYWDQPPTRAHFGDSPLGGAHIFLIGGLYTVAQWSAHASVRDRAQHFAQLLWPAVDDATRWDKWHFCTPVAKVP